MSVFDRLLSKFSKRKEENFALASLKGVYVNPPNETEWTQAIEKCVVSFGKNANDVFVIRILQADENGKDKSLYRFPVYNNFEYDAQSPTWHSWFHKGVYYGLEFEDAAEANVFQAEVQKKKLEAPPPPAVVQSKPKKPLSSEEKVQLEKTAQKFGLPSHPDAIKVYEHARIQPADLEDEKLRKEVEEELDNLETANIIASKHER